MIGSRRLDELAGWRPKTLFGFELSHGGWNTMTRVLSTKSAWIGLLAFVAAVRTDEPASVRLAAAGRWVLMRDGEPAPHDDFIRGLQTSGLAFDGKLLWSVGDQRSAFPGALFAIRPGTGRLEFEPMPLEADEPKIKQQIAAWGRIDAEGIEVLSREERRFVVLIEDQATAAMVVRIAEPSRAMVEAIWEFQFPDGAAPRPYRDDRNYRLEGIAIDAEAHRGYVAFERDYANRPHLYQFDLSAAPRAGIGSVQLAELPFRDWDKLGGRPRTLLNANGLEFFRTAAGEPRLMVLCRDRELFFIMNPESGRLVAQFEVEFNSPDGERIEWASPEGIALDRERGIVYIISDPDSTDGNWRLRSTPRATGLFAKYVPLLFDLKLPAELSESQPQPGFDSFHHSPLGLSQSFNGFCTTRLNRIIDSGAP